MGIFNSLVQIKDGNYSDAMRPTAGGVFTPSNPGRLDTRRSVPIVPNTREFSPVEAERLAVLAEQRSEIAQASEVSYRALETIEQADQKIHTANRAYRGTVANQELLKKEADAKYLSGLNTLRPRYGEAAASLLETRRNSDRRLEVLEARTRQVLKGVY
jgi:hypothetical protein